uniref:THAP-type domain-containing protein n=1 Tax=Lygus hesperus TaxID=30085 RepID=A0A146LQM8_LYGHE
MPRKCCVLGCKSNNKIGAPYVSTFSFPKDEAARKLWLSKIGREDMTITQNVGVCGNHFLEEEILRETSAYDDLKNVILTCPLKTPRIREGAFPSIFPTLSPNDVIPTERTPRKAKKKAVKRIKEEADAEEPADETTAKDMLLGALNLDPAAPLTNETKSPEDDLKADKGEVSRTEVKQATMDQVKRLRVSERERKQAKKFKTDGTVKVAPSIFRVRLDQSKISAALNGGVLPAGAVLQNATVPVPNAQKPVANADDPDYCFFTSLCSDFKTIQNPKTKAFLKMEFQRMVFNAKYEK